MLAAVVLPHVLLLLLLGQQVLQELALALEELVLLLDAHLKLPNLVVGHLRCAAVRGVLCTGDGGGVRHIERSEQVRVEGGEDGTGGRGTRGREGHRRLCTPWIATTRASSVGHVGTHVVVVARRSLRQGLRGVFELQRAE